MKEMLKIKGSNCGLFPNALHASFHSRVLTRLKAMSSLALIHVDNDLLADYEETTAVLVDRNREGTGTVKTLDLSEIDTKRDEAVSCVTHTVEAAEWSPLTEVKAAALLLKPVIAPYKKIQTEANDAETILIDGLLNDLHKAEYAAAVTTLHLDEVLDALEELNEQYREGTEARANERLANQREATKTVRRHEDEVYQRICELIYASELLCTEPMQLPDIIQIIQEINIIIDESNASYNRSKGQKNSGKNTEEATETAG